MKNLFIISLLLILLIIPAIALGGHDTLIVSEEEIQYELATGRGVKLAAAGDFEQALHIFDSLLDSDNQQNYTYNYRAMVHYQLKDYQAALKDISKVNSQSRSYFKRGIINARLGKYSKAVKDFIKVAKSASQNFASPGIFESIFEKQTTDISAALYNLGVAHEKNGKFKKALKAYKILSETYSDKDNEYLSVAADRMVELERALAVKETPSGVEQVELYDNLDEYLPNLGKSFRVIVKYPTQVWEEIPEYPKEAERTGITGWVIVWAYLNKRGTVDKAQVFHCSKENLGFERAALDAALKCRYKPAIDLNGEPVPLWIEYKVKFVI